MPSREVLEITIAGHQMRLTVSEEERPNVQAAAQRVQETMQKLQASAGGAASPSKIATMAAFQFAYELTEADRQLEEAEHLEDELARQKDAVKRLESLLARVDDALAF